MNRLRSFGDLQRFCHSEEGLEKWVLQRLEIGDMWWIPDIEVGLSSKERHPWVIIREYSPTRGFVIVCSRTTTADERPAEPGIITPANILPGLDKAGVILMSNRRQRRLNPDNFRKYDYIGRLPEDLICIIREFYNQVESIN